MIKAHALIDGGAYMRCSRVLQNIQVQGPCCNLFDILEESNLVVDRRTEDFQRALLTTQER